MAAPEILNFPDTIRDNFSVVTGQTVDLTAANIKGLRSNQARTRYFSTRIASLPWAYIPDANNDFHSDGFDEGLRYIGGGTFGQVFQGITSGKAYKKMTMKSDYNTPALKELYYREVYLEAFIQTVLQNDPTYGQNIAAIEKVYKDQMPDGTSRDVFYYQMETIRSPNSLGDYLRSQRDPATGLVPRTTLLAILIKLATLLDYFKTTYGFYHRDLHTQNVLFPEVVGGDLPGNRIIKIIDFGQACMKPTSTRKVFSVKNGNCESFDLLIYITSLFQTYRDLFDAESIQFLDSIFNLPTGENLFNLMYTYTRTNELTASGRIPVSYLAYHYRINRGDLFWGRTLRGVGITMFDKFKPIVDRFYPQHFLSMLAYNNLIPAAVTAVSPPTPTPPALPVLPPSPVTPTTPPAPAVDAPAIRANGRPPLAPIRVPRPGSTNPYFWTGVTGGRRKNTRRRKYKKQKSRRRR